MQAEIQWSMRDVLIEWIVQVHQRFPVELSYTIFEHLDHKSLLNAEQVCQKWKELALANALQSNEMKSEQSQAECAPGAVRTQALLDQLLVVGSVVFPGIVSPK